MKKDIPLHQLKDRTNSGLQLKHFKLGDEINADKETLGAHRDDHYLFFFLEQGTASLMIDFHEVYLEPGSLYYILPAQVHHRIKNDEAEGWFIAADTSLVPPECRNVFENQLLLQQSYILNPTQTRQCQNVLSALIERYNANDNDSFYIPVVHSLLQSFITMAAQCYNQTQQAGYKLSRTAELSRQFKKILSEKIRDIKSPSAYAAQLNVSESYLNEALKKTTGFPVSYWIQQEVMMEAKRLLYYSELNVKEIAHQLGYSDHSYFSRYFRKSEGISALAFRTQYRK